MHALLAIAVVAAATASEANEEKKEEHGSEASAKSSEPALLAKERPTCRWSEHESRLTSYMARIRSFEKEISDMIESKHHIENSEKVKLLTQQISFKHQDLAKVIKDYEAERLHVRFQHPDRELEENRRYSMQHLKSLDEIEAAFGIDGRLDRIRKQIGVVFPVTAPTDKMTVRQPASQAPPESDDDMPRGIKLVK